MLLAVAMTVGFLAVVRLVFFRLKLLKFNIMWGSGFAHGHSGVSPMTDDPATGRGLRPAPPCLKSVRHLDQQAVGVDRPHA